MRQVTLRIRHHGEPESDVSARFPSVTLRSVSSLTGRGRRRKRIIEFSGDAEAIEAFVEEFRETEPILDVEQLSPLTGSRVYVAMVYDTTQWDSITEHLSDMGVHYKMGTTITAGWERWTVYLDGGDELSRVIDRLREAGNDVELVTNVEMSELSVPEQLDVGRTLNDLTPRQREALAAAIAVGYYGYGSDGSVDDVAAELGVASTTAWEHLTRAEEKLMSRVGDYLESG
ncbi:MAG: helix-turn-helix domain-containing protein [Halolamina sp.]